MISCGLVWHSPSEQDSSAITSVIAYSRVCSGVTCLAVDFYLLHARHVGTCKLIFTGAFLRAHLVAHRNGFLGIRRADAYEDI